MADSTTIGSAVKAYRLPLILFAFSIVCQIFFTLRFPPSHYKVLRLLKESSIEEVTNAYRDLSANWSTVGAIVPVNEVLKIRYAYELLSNPLWKRDYDNFGIDEQSHVVGNLKELDVGTNLSKLVEHPLIEKAIFGPEHTFNVITSENFMSMFDESKALVIQVFSFGSSRCAKFANSWRRLAALLDGVANVGMVELGEVQLAKNLAVYSFTGQSTFPDGLPAIVAFPPGCRTVNCLHRYEGDLSVDTVNDWVASIILGFPRILYYSKDTLTQRFLAKSSPHKVKVIFFSITGERATPFARQLARDYHNYASFALVLWQEEQFSTWFNMLGVESAPATVFLKDPGVKPIVYHGPANNSWFQTIMEENKHQELPQLRSLTSMELGCDARGNSRAGHNVTVWYCLIVAGRPSPELSELRGTVRKLRDVLLKEDEEFSEGNKDEFRSSTAAVSLRNKRLTFTWLDGEAQNRRCLFYVQTEKSFETCGRRMDMVDVPRLVVARFERNITMEETVDLEKKTPKNLFEALQNDDDVHRASQLVALYNGSYEIPEIIKWVSGIIENGDSKSLPFFRTKTPELVPEDADPIWSKGAQTVLSARTSMKSKIRGIATAFVGDSRIVPILLLVALLSFGKIWLQRNQPVPQNQSKDETRQTIEQEEAETDTRAKNTTLRRRKTEKNQDSNADS